MTPQCTVDADTLRSALMATLDFISKDKTRPNLSGVLLELEQTAFRTVATDGHTLALLTGPCAGNGSTPGIVAVLISGLGAKALAAWLRTVKGSVVDLAIGPGAKELRLSNPSSSVVASLLDETFPPYKQVMPGTVEASTPKVEVAAAYIERASKAAAYVSKYAFLSVGATNLDVVQMTAVDKNSELRGTWLVMPVSI